MIDHSSQGHTIRPGSDRSFGLVFAGAFAAVGVYRAAGGRSDGSIWLGASAVLAVVAVAAPGWLAPFNRLWFRFGLLLARIVQPLASGAIFFLVVTPIGLLMRMSGKDVLRLKREPASATYWIERDPPGPPPATMSRQF
jgi:hypothetical protein